MSVLGSPIGGPMFAVSSSTVIAIGPGTSRWSATVRTSSALSCNPIQEVGGSGGPPTRHLSNCRVSYQYGDGRQPDQSEPKKVLKRVIWPASRRADLVALGVDHVPTAAELDGSLAFDLARRMVASVVIERVAVVGQLRSPVRSHSHRNRGWVEPRARCRSLLGRHGGPGHSACSVAPGHVVSLEVEEVDRP